MNVSFKCPRTPVAGSVQKKLPHARGRFCEKEEGSCVKKMLVCVVMQRAKSVETASLLGEACPCMFGLYKVYARNFEWSNWSETTNHRRTQKHKQLMQCKRERVLFAVLRLTVKVCKHFSFCPYFSISLSVHFFVSFSCYSQSLCLSFIHTSQTHIHTQRPSTPKNLNFFQLKWKHWSNLWLCFQ